MPITSWIMIRDSWFVIHDSWFIFHMTTYSLIVYITNYWIELIVNWLLEVDSCSCYITFPLGVHIQCTLHTCISQICKNIMHSHMHTWQASMFYTIIRSTHHRTHTHTMHHRTHTMHHCTHIMHMHHRTRTAHPSHAHRTPSHAHRTPIARTPHTHRTHTAHHRTHTMHHRTHTTHNRTHSRQPSYRTLRNHVSINLCLHSL